MDCLCKGIGYGPQPWTTLLSLLFSLYLTWYSHLGKAEGALQLPVIPGNTNIKQRKQARRRDETLQVHVPDWVTLCLSQVLSVHDTWAHGKCSASRSKWISKTGQRNALIASKCGHFPVCNTEAMDEKPPREVTGRCGLKVVAWEVYFWD